MTLRRLKSLLREWSLATGHKIGHKHEQFFGKIQNSGRRNTPNSAGENKERDLKGSQNLEEVTNEPKLYKLLFLLELLLSELGNCSGKPGSIF